MGVLDGKVALVTGSSSGIGEATAHALAGEGASVVVNSSTSVEAGRAVAAALPIEGHYLQGDISDEAQCQRLIADTVERFGKLDILINNAGWTTRVNHADHDALTNDILFKTIEVNVYGTWWMCKAAMPHLKQTDGCIVNVTSIAGLRPLGSSVAYGMAKAALNMMTRTSAADFAKAKIYMTAVDTGWINDEKPAAQAAADAATHNFQTPIDEIDAAARVLDPIIAPLRRLEAGEEAAPPVGVFLKDYDACEW